MTNQTPPLTAKQQEILKLIYRYRFLNRIQIQALLKHKDKKRILSWLKDLREKQCVNWHYDPNDFIAKSRPGIYYLDLNGIRYLRSLNTFSNEELRKRYKEPNRSQQFIDKSLLIADCCITLLVSNKESYDFDLEADTSINSTGNLRPHLSFIKQHAGAVTNYLLEIFDVTLPRHQLRRRLKNYVDHLVNEDWKDHLDTAPIILLVCPTTAELIYAKRRIRMLLEDESAEGYAIRVTTTEKLRGQGITSLIWEEV